jgi:hypothetical protein
MPSVTAPIPAPRPLGEAYQRETTFEQPAAAKKVTTPRGAPSFALAAFEKAGLEQLRPPTTQHRYRHIKVVASVLAGAHAGPEGIRDDWLALRCART